MGEDSTRCGFALIPSSSAVLSPSLFCHTLSCFLMSVMRMLLFTSVYIFIVLLISAFCDLRPNLISPVPSFCFILHFSCFQNVLVFLISHLFIFVGYTVPYNIPASELCAFSIFLFNALRFSLIVTSAFLVIFYIFFFLSF
jgi:hypothetical protein